MSGGGIRSYRQEEHQGAGEELRERGGIRQAGVLQWSRIADYTTSDKNLQNTTVGARNPTLRCVLAASTEYGRGRSYRPRSCSKLTPFAHIPLGR